MHDDLLAAIDIFYDCAESSFDHQRAISAFSRAVDDTGLCLVDIQLDGKFSLFAYENIPPDSMSMMLNGPWDPETHGILRNFARIPLGVPVLHRAVESDEEFYASALYRLAMQPWDLHSIGLCLLKKAQAGGILNGFIRNPGQDEINADMLSRMAVLNKHLLRAMQLQHRVDGIEKALIRANNVLDLIEFGLVLYGKDGIPVFVNAAAKRIFGQRDGLSMDRHGIVVSDRAAQRQLRDLLDGLGRPGLPAAARAGGLVVVSRPSHGKPYGLLVVPLQGRDVSALDGAGIAVLVFDPSARRTTVVELFAATYNLTQAEARLAAALAEGSSLEKYADRWGISRNTAKSQLHAIFAKTDTNRQPELVSLLLRSVAGISLASQEVD